MEHRSSLSMKNISVKDTDEGSWASRAKMFVCTRFHKKSANVRPHMKKTLGIPIVLESNLLLWVIYITIWGYKD